MAKLYSQTKPTEQVMLPKKETVDFLLSFSRSLTIVRTENGIYENIAN
ncbi:hypothetical protein ACLI09_05930 [Flavobacterium sp. RHBU_24]